MLGRTFQNMQVARKAIAAIAAAGTLAASAVALWRRFGPSTYVRIPTMFGKARVYQVSDDEGADVRLLEVGGIVQSGTYLDERYADLVFEYLKRYDLMFSTERRIRHVAVLGCGGYDYPEHLIAHYPEVTCDAVEIDPAITAIARRYFHLDRIIEEYDAERSGRLNLVCADALDFLKTADRLYDAIVNDTFDAGKPPAHLTTLEFYRAAHDCLMPGGMFLTNIVSPLVGPDATFLWRQVRLMELAFSHVGVYPCATDEFADSDNVIVIASDGAIPSSDRYAG